MTQRVLLAAAVVLGGACASDEPAARPTTTTVAPVAAVPPFSSANCCEGNEVDAGEYRTPGWFDIPLTMTIGGGWRVVNEQQAQVFALVQGENELGDASRWLYFMVAPDLAPLDVANQLVAMPGFTVDRAAFAVTIGRMTGLRLEAAAQPNPDFAGNADAGIPAGTQELPVLEQFVTPGFQMTTATPEARLRFDLFEATGATIVVMAEAPPGEFDAFATAVGSILTTLASL